MINKLPTVDIKGKEYILVKDRVLYFNETYPNGAIVTSILTSFQAPMVIVQATIYPDYEKQNGRYFCAHAQETIGDGYINKTSALENCETSAVGRALAMMGIGIVDSIASVDEINKAENKSFEITGRGLDETSPRKTCDSCKQEFNPKPGTEAWSTRCYPCYKQHGTKKVAVITRDPNGEDVPDTSDIKDSDIPF